MFSAILSFLSCCFFFQKEVVESELARVLGIKTPKRVADSEDKKVRWACHSAVCITEWDFPEHHRVVETAQQALTGKRSSCP